MTTQVTATAPGRVNIVGDHTDYTGGLCLPMAIDRWVTIVGTASDDGTVRLDSEDVPGQAVIPLDVSDSQVSAMEPAWARYVAAVMARLPRREGFHGTIRSTLAAGSGLSSSAALEVAAALALGADSSDPIALARLCQEAEHVARGVPTGILDQVASICGVANHAVLIDCHSVDVRPVALPPADEVSWVVIWSGARDLGASAYTQRTNELAQAEREIGPLRLASLDDLGGVTDATTRRRARHVVTENERVREFMAALDHDDVRAAGTVMDESHESLRSDFESSTPTIDELCARLRETPGVLGARITGGGWGGAVIALTRPGTLERVDARDAWTVTAVDGARRLEEAVR